MTGAPRVCQPLVVVVNHSHKATKLSIRLLVVDAVEATWNRVYYFASNLYSELNFLL